MVARVLVNNTMLERDIRRAVKEYPFALSRALGQTVERCRDRVRSDFRRNIHRPRSSTIKNVSMRFPNKSQVRQGDATAFVFIREPLLDAIHAQVLGGRVDQTGGTSSVPDGSDGFVITPVNVKLNKFGNIASIRKKLARWRGDRSKYLEVPLNNSDPKTKHLQPGFYERKAPRRTRRNRRTGRRRRRANGEGVQGSLVMLVAYSSEREYRALLPYHETILDCYERWFPGLLTIQMRKWGRN